MLEKTLKVIRIVFIALSGTIVLALGIAMIPTPGPGIPLILAGLAILAIQFVWAKKLLKSLKKQGTRLKDFFFKKKK